MVSCRMIRREYQLMTAYRKLDQAANTCSNSRVLPGIEACRIGLGRNPHIATSLCELISYLQYDKGMCGWHMSRRYGWPIEKDC